MTDSDYPMASEIESVLSLQTPFDGEQQDDQHVADERWLWADRLGAGLSLSCALHCLILPVALALMPSLRAALADVSEPSGWLQWLLWSHEVEWVIALSVISFAGVVMLRGWFRHRQTSPLYWYAAGSAVLLLTAAGVVDFGVYHGIQLAVGGAMIAMAHWRNLRATVCRIG